MYSNSGLNYTILKKESKDSVALDLQNDYICFGYYRDINFVQEDFQVICKVRVIVLIVEVKKLNELL